MAPPVGADRLPDASGTVTSYLNEIMLTGMIKGAHDFKAKRDNNFR